MAQQNNSILLHACCGICSGFPITNLKDMGYVPVVYFCNHNLDTEDEYNKRLTAQQKVCAFHHVQLVAEPYNHKIFLDAIQGYENEPEKGYRCELCISQRLELTAQKAFELGFEIFATSLTISPHKNYQKITKIGINIAEKYGLKYLDTNFRKNDGFLKTNKIASELNLYRQNYCGCEFAKGHLK